MLGCDAIAAGSADMIVAGGMESMSNAPYLLPKARAGMRMGHGEVKDHMFLDGLEDAYDKGRLMGTFAEDCAQAYQFTREAQDEWAYQTHKRAAAGWDSGFFSDLVIPLPELARDANVRADTSLEKLASLKPVFDTKSGKGTLTAGNSTPITDGAAGLWVASAQGLKRLNAGPAVKLRPSSVKVPPLVTALASQTKAPSNVALPLT